MSFLVELPRDAYRNDAFETFDAISVFRLANASALMWMSQLAYETAHEGKIKDVLASWKLRLRAFIDNPPATRLPLRTACAIVAEGDGATIVAFAGTDPLKINDWITDFNTLPSKDGVHTGFQSAVAAIWPRISAAIVGRPEGERLFFTGHSLGGALAIIAAAQGIADSRVRPDAIYTYGSPRPGGPQFADLYTPMLGHVTYRLICGTDIVPTVPPSLAGFRHVGCALQCTSDGCFDPQDPMSSPDSDVPDFLGSLFASVRTDLQALAAGRLFAPVGEGLAGRLIGLLPRQIREHLPQTYFRALTP